MQAYCLAGACTSCEETSARSDMRRFLQEACSVVPFILVDAHTGRVLAQAGVDLAAIVAAGADLHSAQLPLQDANGDSVAVLMLSITAVCGLSQPF